MPRILKCVLFGLFISFLAFMLRILPFGRLVYEELGEEPLTVEKKEKKKKYPTYIVPKTTDGGERIIRTLQKH